MIVFCIVLMFIFCNCWPIVAFMCRNIFIFKCFLFHQLSDKDLYSDFTCLYWTQQWTWIYASYFSKVNLKQHCFYSKLTVEIYKMISKQGYFLTPTSCYFSGTFCYVLFERKCKVLGIISNFIGAQYYPECTGTMEDFTGFLKCNPHTTTF